MTSICKHILLEHEDAWATAIRHPFLDHCQDGTIEAGQFNTWLVQDYLFVTEFTRMAARLLVAAPIAHFDGILGGLAALKDELNWFHAKAEERQLNLDMARQATCQAYCDFMEGLRSEPYAVQAAAYWAIEAVYNQAWQLASPMAAPYDEFADRWGNADFTAYVTLLERQADEVLTDSPEIHQKRTEEVVLRIMELEKLFWQMAFEGGVA